MSDALIRAATRADADQIRVVVKAAYAPWTKVLPDLPDVSAGIEDDIAAGRVWVAVEGDKVLGTLIGGISAEHWHVANVAVSPDDGGKGIGRSLMEFALAQAKREGVRDMALATHHLMPGNVALYEHLGWQVSGEDGNKVLMRRRTDT